MDHSRRRFFQLSVSARQNRHFYIRTILYSALCGYGYGGSYGNKDLYELRLP